MISIVLSKSVDKSNTKYYDVVIKWLNITTLTVNIDKRYTLYYNLVIKSYFIITLSYYLLLYQAIITFNVIIVIIILKYCYYNSKHS